MLQMVCLCKTD